MSDIIARGMADQATKKAEGIEKNVVEVNRQLADKAKQTDLVLANKAQKITKTEHTQRFNKLYKKNNTFPTISIITGLATEPLLPSNLTISADTTNYKLNNRAWKLSTAGAVTNANGIMTLNPPLQIKPAQAACMWVFIEDATKVTNIQLELMENTGIIWSRANAQAAVPTLTNGWNFLRWKLVGGMPSEWTSTQLTRVRVLTTTSEATAITVGHVYLETPEKAKMIFILDRGYKTFVDYGGVARCRALGIPITWALDITQLGRNVGDAFDVVTEADIEQYAREGDSISFHGWDGAVTSTMTPEQYLLDTTRSIKWLKDRGYEGRMWRAANVQDTAPPLAVTAAMPYLVGNCQSTMPSVRLDCFPPLNFNNIPRWNFYGRPNAEVTNQMGLLKKTNGLLVAYNHGIQASYAHDATPAEFEHFFGLVKQAIIDGWLEPTTFEQLYYESGGEFREVDSTTVSRYKDVKGEKIEKIFTL